MARKSRKQPLKVSVDNIRNTVGYIRLSVANKDASCSVENQKLIIEQWAAEHELPINHFYIDANHTGSNFDRPAFRQMLADIDAGHIECILVEDFLLWLEIRRGCSTSTRNNRLAAIHAFYTYLQYEAPHFLERCQEILSIS